MILGQAGNSPQNVEDVINSLRQSRGNFSAHVFARIARTDPFFKYISQEKMAFPSQRGDIYEREVMHITTPTENDLGTWSQISKASAGYNPSADTFDQVIQYGWSKQTCRLYRKGFRTPDFNKISLALTFDLDQQIANVKEAITSHTAHIWPAWARREFRRAARCLTLASAYGFGTEQDGGYVTNITPTSLLTHQGLESILPGIMACPTITDTPGMKNQPDIPDQVVFMGYQEFNELEKQYQKDTLNYGFRAPDITVPELGLSGKKIGKYLFVLEMFPTRFRDLAGGETSWEQAIISPTIKVPTQGGPVGGMKDAPNPDYYNPAIAKYAEAKIYNTGTVIWFTPPSDVLNGMKKGELFQFPASTYTGDFFPVNLKTREDPEAENIFFIAKYISGMMAANPGRSRCVLGLAAQANSVDYAITGQLPVKVGPFFKLPIQVASVAPNGDLLIWVGTDVVIPAVPGGYSLWAVRADDTKYKLASVVSTTATAGNGTWAAGYTLDVTLVDGTQQAKDPGTWDSLVCLKD